MSDTIDAGKNKSTSLSNPLVFLNTPICDNVEDVIGFQSHVDTLQAAINENAQMIAITSPFGAGKSSVTELLRTKKDNQRVVNISMWSHLCKKEDTDGIRGSTTELHRSFLYQIVAALNSRNGAYISRRLSKNYGLLKLHTESSQYYVVAFLSLVFFILGYVIPYVFNVGIPVICGVSEVWNGLLLLASVICLIYVIVRAEVVFSSKKSEGTLTIDENELKELYRKFVFDYCNKQKKIQKFIFVVEDLDRTNERDCVVTFLKELRKYYTLENSTQNKKNKIVFIVNVKPETSLCSDAKEHKNKESESLYAKLFDFVLNIQTINIDDYETILESILKSSQETISAMFPNIDTARFVDIPGMQWIIRGKYFGIRDVKDRLNRAFALYRSLQNRFPSSPIEFEKCAVVAYLTTAYEQEFITTDDRSFGKLVEAHLQNSLNEDICYKTLGENQKEYAKEVFALVEAKLIDTNYRMYFYNYPQNSKIYSYDEHSIQNAILYGDAIEGLDEMAIRITNNNVAVVYDALDRLKKLKMPLPDVIFKSEPLFIATLDHYPDGVYEWMSKLDYSQSALEKTSQQIFGILSFDKERSVYANTHAIQFCKIWEEKIKENNLLQFRQKLCSNFSKEIIWYKQLFMGVHNIASYDELDLISLKDVIKLTNIQKDTFNVNFIQYILGRFEKDASLTAELDNDVQAFLLSSEKKLGSSATVSYLLQYMNYLHIIVPKYEEIVMNQLTSGRIPDAEKNNLFRSYQNLINSIAPENLTEVTLKNIQVINIYDGYSEGVSDTLDKSGYVFEANIVRLYLNIPIEFRSEETIIAIKENLNWLLNYVDIFVKLREAILKSSDEKNIFEYIFLFSEKCPILSANEFSKVKFRYSDEVILKLIPASNVTSNELSMLTEFFNRHFQQNTTAYKFLAYIAGMPHAVAKECFYKLNFVSAIKYSSFSAKNKKNIKNLYGKILGLDAVAEKIKFMDATRFLDSSWEDNIYDTIRTSSNLQKSYVEAVNKAVEKSITSSTVKCICAFSTLYGLNDSVTSKLYTAKKYKYYVLCKALYHKRFTLDNSERIDILWETYMEIFTGTNNRDIREYMDSNHDMLKLIMNKKAYTNLTNERLNVLCGILQDADLLQEAIKRGETFASNYYKKIGGFTNEIAAKKFVSIIEDNPSLLQSQEIYKNCYEKLPNSALKAKYTRLCKKYGYIN